MPIDMNVFIQQANIVAKDTQFYVKNENITQQSTLTGLKKLFIFARRAENNSAAKSFLTALSNKIPQGHGTSFGQFAVVRDLPLETTEDYQKAIKEYLLEQVISEKMYLPMLDMGSQERTKAMEKILRSAAAPLDGQNGFFAKQIDTLFEAGYAAFSFRNLIHSFHTENLPVIEQLQAFSDKVIVNIANSPNPADTLKLFTENLPVLEQINAFSGNFVANIAGSPNPADTLKLFTENLPFLEQLNKGSNGFIANIANSPNPADILKLFNEAAGAVPEKELFSLRFHSSEMGISLDSPESRANCITHYMVERQGTSAAENVMTAHDLPKEFASAVGHNPEVAAKARKLLAENPGPGHVPTQARVAEALAQAAEELTEKYETQLQEFKGMAENPIYDLKPALSVATMPRYINCLLAGERLFEPLLADGIALDEKTFIDDLAKYAEAMNSATHSVKGDFGTDDSNQVAQNSVRILLAKHNVINQSQYLEVMNRIEHKFGKLACDLTVLNSFCQRRLGVDDSVLPFLVKGLTMYRALENHAKVLISMLNHDQKVELHLAEGLAPENSLEAQKREGDLLDQYLEKNFQAGSDLNGISSALRDFAEHSGLRMPAIGGRRQNKA